jgi:hypothetical protein
MQEDYQGGGDIIYDDEEIRHMFIQVMTAPTARDQQTVIGASDLSNQCDHCLALALAGVKRESMIGEKTWMGRTFGTAIDHYTEERGTAQPALLGGDVEFQKRVIIGHIPGYGDVPGSIDWTLPNQLVDMKSSTKKKSALLQDYFQSLGIMRVGLKPHWEHQKRGNYKLDLGSGMSASLSERDYQAEMKGMAYKVNGYFGQLCLYGLGCANAGIPVQRATILFVNRDGVGFFDVPHHADYVNPARKHDVWTIGFQYSEAHALALLARGEAIFIRLQAGEPFAAFPRHDDCFQCSEELRSEERNVDVVATFPAAA